MSAIITPGLRSVSLDAKNCRPTAKRNPTSCAYCRSFLERPLAPRCTYASPPEHDLIVLGPQDCRFCQMLLDERAHLMAPYKQSEPFKVKVYFEDEYPHRTHRSNWPRQTTCRIKIENLGRISDEEDEEHNAIFEVKPVFNKTFRRENPPSRIIRPLVARNSRDVRALEFIKYWTTECRPHHKTCNNSIAAMVDHSSDCLPKRPYFGQQEQQTTASETNKRKTTSGLPLRDTHAQVGKRRGFASMVQKQGQTTQGNCVHLTAAVIQRCREGLSILGYTIPMDRYTLHRAR
jgi:hypothetical protein